MLVCMSMCSKNFIVHVVDLCARYKRDLRIPVTCAREMSEYKLYASIVQ